jgi:hypothetical protein
MTVARKLASVWLCSLAAAVVLLAIVGAPSALGGSLPEEYALQPTEATVESQEAATHADFETKFKFEFDPTRQESCFYPGCPNGAAWANMRDLATELPPGLLGNASAFPTCSSATFVSQTAGFEGGTPEFCGSDTQVGWVSPGLGGTNFITFPPGLFKEPLYNLEPPGGDSHIVARFGFVAILFPIFIDVHLDPKKGYSLTATVVNVPQLLIGRLIGTYTRFWGVPTDESHDNERFNPAEALSCGGPCQGPVPSGLPPTPFMSNPTSCGPKTVGTSTVSYERWTEGWIFDPAPLGEITNCAAVPFEPSMTVTPTTRNAGVASGLEVNLQIPQAGWANPKGKASSDLRNSVVELPKEISLNASTADGLESCSKEQIGFDNNERQLVDWDGHGAPVSLSLDGQKTSELPQRATAQKVQAALEGLPAVGAGNVSVSGRLGGPWIVDFRGALAGKDVSTIGGTNSELQRVSLRAGEGTYTLEYEGQKTGSLPYNAEAPQVQTALESLSTISPGQVDVIGGPSTAGRENHVFRIAFTGGLSQTDVPKIVLDPSALGFAETFVETLAEGGSSISTEVIAEGGNLRFNNVEPSCPQGSKIATGEVVTPVLKQPLKASFYIAKQQDNPFSSLFAGYLVTKGAGATIKVAARIDVDPQTGQIVTTFEENPEQPITELNLRFKSGNRGLVTTPEQCGTYASTYELTPWSGQQPVTGTSKFKIDQNCGQEFAPTFSAGSERPLAGAYTTFFTRVSREANSPRLTGLSVSLPPGLTAKLAGIPYCPDSALASVSAALGTGAAQVLSPNCPAASQVGTVQAGTGSGAPFYINTGKVYLAGPYKGAPISLAVVVPVVAGPFDLGSQLVRVAVTLDPVTAQVEAASDPLPLTVHGLPVDLRDLRVNLDRPSFALNPTSCAEKEATATIDGEGGLVGHRSQRFQIGECAALGFKPKVSLRLKGGTKRTKHPALTAIIRPRLGDANMASIAVTLPPSELLDQANIDTVCTKVQWAAETCPAGSIYGTVEATTPLLESPLSGNVYLRSSSHNLPDLVTDLRGPASQPIRLEAAGRTDTVGTQLRNTFEFIPDAPLSRVVLHLHGGKNGLIENNTNICAQVDRAAVLFGAHNGRSYGVNPKVVTSCGGKRKGKGRH